MRASEFLKPSKFLKKENVERDGDQTHTIRAVESAEFKDRLGGLELPKLQLVFDDDLRFTLNDTNNKLLQRHYGDDTDRWVGRPIVVWFDETVQFQGRTVGGLRVRIPRPTAKPASKAARPAVEPDEIDEAMPTIVDDEAVQ